MSRPRVEDIHMQTAMMWESRSTCSRNHVGAVLTRDGRSIVTGYNGAPSGMPHCDHSCDCDIVTIGTNMHSASCAVVAPCGRAVHAEANVIAFAARNGIETRNTWLYTTMAPCMTCSMLLLNADVFALTFGRVYRDMSGVDMLAQAGVAVRQCGGISALAW